MDLQYKRIVENYRLGIRRRQIDEMIQVQRYQMLREENKRAKQLFCFQLQHNQDRQKWINQIALQLAGSPPNQQFSKILNQLFWAVPLFENDHEIWVNLDIVKSITDIFTPEQFDQNMCKVAANILTDILHLSAKSNNQRVIKKILQLQYVDNLMLIIEEHPYVQLLRLVAITSNIALQLRNYLIHKGLLTFLVDKLKEQQDCLNKNSQYFNCLIYLTYVLLRNDQSSENTLLRPKKSTILKLLPFLSVQLPKSQSIQNLTLILKSISQICSLKKQEIYNQIFKYQGILNQCAQFMCFESRIEVRTLSMKILTNFLLSQDIEHSYYLVNKGILDKLLQSYRLASNNCNIVESVLQFLSNLTADVKQFQDLTYNHTLFIEVIIPSLYSQQESIKKEGVYTVCNILRQIEQSQQNLQRIVQLKIFEYFIDALKNESTQVNTSREIIQLWKIMLLKQQFLENSPINYILTSFYGIEQVLENFYNFDDLQKEIIEVMDIICLFGK